MSPCGLRLDSGQTPSCEIVHWMHKDDKEACYPAGRTRPGGGGGIEMRNADHIYSKGHFTNGGEGGIGWVAVSARFAQPSPAVVRARAKTV